MMKPGMPIFSRTIRQRGKDGAILEAKTHKGIEVISIVVGAYKTKDPLPTRDDLVELVGQIGFYPGDLLRDVFGDKGLKKLQDAFKKKYFKESK